MRTVMMLLVLLGFSLSAQEYRIAVVGLVHSHVWEHLDSMAKSESVQLVGISESNPELVSEVKKATADRIPIFSDYRRMLDELKPDIVWAFVENNRHLEIVEECAPRKINVIFEKPLASTYKEALAIRRLAREQGIQVMTNYQMAWWPSNYAAKAEADAGTIGKVWRLHGIVGHGGINPDGVRVKHFFAWLTDPVKNGGGALMDFGCYNALWSLWYMDRPERVFAQVNHLRPKMYPKVEDNASFILSYKNGVGIFESSWDFPRVFQDLEVYGRGGSIYMMKGRVELREGSKEVRQIHIEPLPPEKAEPVAYMVHCLRTKKPVGGVVGLDINVGVHEIIEAAIQSVKTGQAVRLPLKVDDY